jgi:outer membrane protein TolC
MSRSPLLLLCAAACHSYAPAPVDLAAHAAAFAARLPDGPTLRALQPADAEPFAVDLADGIDRREARWIAICFQPDCRLARAAAGAAAVDVAHAGTLPDPELTADAARILEAVPHRWLAGAAVRLTLPLSGRLSLARQLAEAVADEQLAAAYAAERAAAAAVDAAWCRYSAEHVRRTQLEELCARLRDLEAIARRLAEDGALSQAGARAFALERARRELELQAAADAIAAGELELRRLLGLHPSAPVAFVPDLIVTPDIADGAARLASLPTTPRLVQLRLAHRRTERALELAVREQWPDLVLAPGWQEEDAQPRAALGLVLPLPLWAGNRRAIARAHAERDLAADALRAGHEEAVHALAAAELRVARAAARAGIVFEQLVPLADRQVDDCRRLAALGQLEPLLLLDALVRAHDARQQAIDAALEHALAIAAQNSCCGLPESDDDGGSR